MFGGPTRDGVRFQFRMEFYNIFNNVNYGNSGWTFGVPLAASFGRITSAGTMRQVQLGGQILLTVTPVGRSFSSASQSVNGRRRR